MWIYFVEFLRSNPVALLFAVLGLGYLVGKTKIRGFEIGSVTGVLFVGLVFGHFGFDFDPTVQSMGFVLFIFSVGLQAGPSFFSVLRQDGVRYFALAVGYVFGSKVLALNPVFLLGGITGSMTSGVSLSIVTGEARSSLPSLGYTGAYAFANILLTVAGSVIMLL